MIIKIVNDGEEAVTLPDGTIVEAGAEIEAPAEKIEAVMATIYAKDEEEKTEGEATEEGAETEGEEKAEEAEAEQEEAETKDEETTEEEATEKVEEAKLSEERKALAEERAKLAEERAEMTFTKLCEEGRVVPAQKEAYMALASKGGYHVAEGDTKTIAELLNDFIQSAPKCSLMEEEGTEGEGSSEPEITPEEKSVAEQFGNTEEELKNYKG